MKLNNQKGISFVEILVSLVISLFLLGGIIQVYIGNKAAYTFSNSISRVQENGRYALDVMTQDLRMAGFWGCAVFDAADTSNMTSNLDPNGDGYDAAIYDFINQDAIGGTDNDGLNGSDSLTLRGAKPTQVNVHPPYNVSTSAMLHVTANDQIEEGDIVVVSNCLGADIFQVTNTTNSTNASQNAVVHNTGSGSPGNFNPDSCQGGNAHCLSQTYGADSAMFELQTVTYTIAAGESGEPALFRAENGVDAELIDGIENMQVLYGIDTDDDDYPNQYMDGTTLAANAAVSSVDIISIRLMLLVRSDDQFVVEEPQSYTFNGDLVVADDRRLRQVYSTTIALRNRVGDEDD
ncbi:MAG: type IV pilus assembly protein PilW [Gammaproteobacteria bacterium]|jgi:type IV pilus assembly protein PilW